MATTELDGRIRRRRWPRRRRRRRRRGQADLLPDFPYLYLGTPHTA